MGDLERRILMWRTELERQNASLGIMAVFESMLVDMGELHRASKSKVTTYKSIDNLINERGND